MKLKHMAVLNCLTVFTAIGNLAHADVTLFQDGFETGTLDQWIGKAGDPPQGLVVADPLNPANQVLTFSGVNYSGDIFSATYLDVSLPRQYVLSFDFLGFPSEVENGGFIGIGAAPTSDSEQFWIGGTYPGALTAPASVATVLTVDGAWHHYEIDITEIIETEGLTETLLMVEDWFNYGSVPGDAFFDNISLVGLFDLNVILNEVPCEGPSPRMRWRNHGQYVSAVAAVATEYLDAGIITEEEAEEVVSLAAESDCGKWICRQRPVYCPKPILKHRAFLQQWHKFNSRFNCWWR